MDAILETIRSGASGDGWPQVSSMAAASLVVTFTLVAARLAGALLIGPFVGLAPVPLQLRILVVAGMSLVLTPALTLDSQPAAAPESACDYAWLIGVEFAVGAALGLGVSLSFSALRIAGDLIDQQLGIAMGDVLDPEAGSDAGLSGRLFHRLGLIVFLVCGGHLIVVSALLDLYRKIPVGYARIDAPLVFVLRDLVHQSLALAIQVALPVLATMAVVGLALGFAGRTLPQLNVLAVSAPVRMLAGIVILGLALTAGADVLGRVVPEVVAQVRDALLGA